MEDGANAARDQFNARPRPTDMLDPRPIDTLDPRSAESHDLWPTETLDPRPTATPAPVSVFAEWWPANP